MLKVTSMEYKQMYTDRAKVYINRVSEIGRSMND